MSMFPQNPWTESGAGIPVAARATVVNRTHRVVREQALVMREQKQKRRSLWVPVGIASVLLPVLCYAAWLILDGYDITPTGIPDATEQMFVLVLWFLPVSLFMLVLVWFKRGRDRASQNAEVRR